MKVILATNNKNKVREMKTLLHGKFDEILSLGEAGLDIEPEENGATFLENAVIKAKAVSAAGGCPAIADDSGLCVDALGGAPGVFSARFSGVHGDDQTNNDLLLEKMRGLTERGAKYVSAIAMCYPGGEIVSAIGECRGEILLAPSGNGGFGYDPLFFIKELGKTMAEITLKEKNTISHRAKAIEEFVKLT